MRYVNRKDQLRFSLLAAATWLAAGWYLTLGFSFSDLNAAWAPLSWPWRVGVAVGTSVAVFVLTWGLLTWGARSRAAGSPLPNATTRSLRRHARRIPMALLLLLPAGGMAWLAAEAGDPATFRFCAFSAVLGLMHAASIGYRYARGVARVRRIQAFTRFARVW